MDEKVLIKQLRTINQITVNTEVKALTDALIDYYKEQKQIGIQNGKD